MKHTTRRIGAGRVVLAGAAAALGSLTTAVACAAAPPPPPPSPAGSAADRSCLQALTEAGVSFVERGEVRGIRTPVEVVGPIHGVRLLSRGKRPALMDCALARSLAEAAPIFQQAGVTGLSFSAAYDYRPVRGTTRLSEHAHGLAIDVHAFQTRSGLLDVTRDFPRAGLATAQPGGDLRSCIGAPPTDAGRTLRALACALQHHPSFRFILTPDDNQDHHNHFHIESLADGARGWVADRGRPSAKASAPARRSESGRAVRRRHQHHGRR